LAGTLGNCGPVSPANPFSQRYCCLVFSPFFFSPGWGRIRKFFFLPPRAGRYFFPLNKQHVTFSLWSRFAVRNFFPFFRTGPRLLAVPSVFFGLVFFPDGRFFQKVTRGAITARLNPVRYFFSMFLFPFGLTPFWRGRPPPF